MNGTLVTIAMLAYVVISILSINRDGFKAFVHSLKGKAARVFVGFVVVCITAGFVSAGVTAGYFNDWVYLPVVGLIGIRLLLQFAIKSVSKIYHILFWLHIFCAILIIVRWYL